MRARGGVVCGLTAILCIGPNIIGRADIVSVKKELDVQYAKICAAIKARNVKAVMAFDTPDYKVQIDPKTTLTRADVEKAYQQQVNGTQEIKEISFTVVDVKLEGEQAIATVRTREVIQLGSLQQIFSGAIQPVKHILIGKQTAVDTWVKTPRGWRLNLEQVTSRESTLDGKLMSQTPSASAGNTDSKQGVPQQTAPTSKSDSADKSNNPPK